MCARECVNVHMRVSVHVCVCVYVCVCVLNTEPSTELLTYLTIFSLQSESKFCISNYLIFTAMQNISETTMQISLFYVTEINAFQISLKILTVQ